MSRTGLVIAILYMGLAIGVVAMERGESGGGNFISLRGMMSGVVTLPVTMAFESIGIKLDFRRNLDMAFAILTCAALLYLLTWLITKGILLLRYRT